MASPTAYQANATISIQSRIPSEFVVYTSAVPYLGTSQCIISDMLSELFIEADTGQGLGSPRGSSNQHPRDTPQTRSTPLPRWTAQYMGKGVETHTRTGEHRVSRAVGTPGGTGARVW